MPSVKIYRDGDEVEVWCGVDGDNIINAHIIGLGATRDEAIAAAVAHLEQTLVELQETPDFPVSDVKFHERHGLL